MTNYPTKLPGRIYKRRNKRSDGTTLDHSTWTVRYKGKDHSTGESDPKKAEQFLLKLIAGGTAEARPIPAAKPWMQALAIAPHKPHDGILMAELFKGYVRAARRAELRGIMNVERHARNLTKFFGNLPAADLTSTIIDEYIDQRLEAGMAHGSVNQELMGLKRALNLALEATPPLIDRAPKITMLKNAPPRQGFLSHNDYATLKAVLPPYLVPVFVTAYHVGCRRSELLQVEFSDIEMDARQPQFRLYPDATKNGEGRVIPIYGEMLAVFREQMALTRRDYPTCKLLFHNEGVPIQTFRKAWSKAIALARVDGLLFHDLRRTAVRNLIRAGVKRKAAMAITGHLTESVFERYNIIDEDDIQDAGDKMTAFFAQQNQQLSSVSKLIS
jgi:integrase